MKRVKWLQTGLAVTTWLAVSSSTLTWAQLVAPALGERPSNQASQRYEINQKFDGQSFLKDNNIWVYTKEFADMFGMPPAHSDAIHGATAAAFRIVDMGFQRCGMGGREDVCMKVEQCLLDLYFDESRNPLPWVDVPRSLWLPDTSSMRWLRTGQANPALSGDIPPGVLPNESLRPTLIPFVDPLTKREAIFGTNMTTNSSNPEDLSWPTGTLGYTRNFYKQVSVVSLQLPCTTTTRKTINLNLDARVQGIYEAPVAKFNRVVLPEQFVAKMNSLLKINSDRNSVFYRSLFSAPLGTAPSISPSSKP